MPIQSTSHQAARQPKVSGDTRYTITIGRPSSAVSSVAVPEATIAASAACTTL